MPSARIVANASSSAAAQSIDPLGRVVQDRFPALAARSSFLWKVKPSGRRLQAVVDLAQAFERDGGLGPAPPRPAGAGSDTGGSMSSSGLSEANACSSTVKCFLTSPSTDSGVCDPCAISVSGELLAHRRVRGDRLVHQRLRERRLVAFVVAVAPVADQVDQEVAPEAARGIPMRAARLRGTPPDRRR